MALPVNAARGEVAVKIGSLEVVIAATMEGLAQVSAATGYPSIQELCQRLVATEVATTRAALRAFIRSGVDSDGKPMKRDRAIEVALRDYRLSDTGALAEGFAAALAPLFRDPGEAEQEPPGNGAGASGAPTTS